MSGTRVRMLVVLAIVAGSTGWALVSLLFAQTGHILTVPWLAAATMWVLALAVTLWALLCRPRLQRKPGARPMPALLAARTAALAMAASRTGSLVTGFDMGVALAALPQRFTPAGANTIWAGMAATAGSMGLVAAALWLERMCRLPLDGDDTTIVMPGSG